MKTKIPLISDPFQNESAILRKKCLSQNYIFIEFTVALQPGPLDSEHLLRISLRIHRNLTPEGHLGPDPSKSSLQ